MLNIILLVFMCACFYVLGHLRARLRINREVLQPTLERCRTMEDLEIYRTAWDRFEKLRLWWFI